MRKLLVGGTFDSSGGKASYIVGELFTSLGSDWECVNGGDIDYVRTFSPNGYNVIIWMPNVSNDEDKILNDLKLKNPRMILIQSKRVIEKEYYPSDVVGRLLKSHSLLGIMISKDDGVYRYRLLDPLGNQWADTNKIADVGQSINARLDYLLSLSRIGSVATSIDAEWMVPAEFVNIVKQYGNAFTGFVNAVNPNRLLGNASTRCTKGFPAIRLNDHILVTRRNVDKATLSEEDFVIAKNTITDRVYYKGANKPSVDTPIQIKLFEHYKNVNYMIHGHVYVKDGLLTSNKVPCGYLEEFDEIKELVPDATQSNFTINLRGHGCLVMANTLDYLREQLDNLCARPFPEN